MDFLSDPISFLAEALRGLLEGWGLAPGLVDTIMGAIGVAVICAFGLGFTIFLIWVERKLGARFQDRIGPNRLGPFGLLQTFADIIKIFTKEHITPRGVDVVVYNLAPLVAVSSVLLLWAVVPFAPTVIGTDINVGLLYLVGIGAFGTLSILMAGWSSNNKFALLGSVRTVAQMISYEIPLVLSLLVIALLGQTMAVGEIVRQQEIWFLFISPLAALIFLISSQAEVGRAPFDLMEAESELVAGYQTEYSGLKFGMFFVGEFLHSFTIGVLFAVLFMGGWRGPGAETYPILGVMYLFIKALVPYFIGLWLRFSLPRIRIDHMLNFNWKFLVPLGLMLLVTSAILDNILLNGGVNMWVRAGSHFVLNVVLLWISLQANRMMTSQRSARKPVGQPRPVAVPPPAEGA